jgi:hypothetical protein
VSLLDTIQDLATGTYPVLRQAKAIADSNGEAVRGATSSLSIVAGVQPTGSDTEYQPEGARSLESQVLWTETELFTDDSDSPYIADVVTYEGTAYRVVDAHRWQDPDCVFYQCTMVRIKK